MNPFDILAKSDASTTNLFNNLNNQIDKAAQGRINNAREKTRGVENLIGLRQNERRLDIAEEKLGLETELAQDRIALDRGRISAAVRTERIKFQREDQKFKIDQARDHYKDQIGRAYKGGQPEEAKRLEAELRAKVRELGSAPVGDVSGLQDDLDQINSVGDNGLQLPSRSGGASASFLDRKQVFQTEIDSDPDLKRLLFASTMAEVGPKGSQDGYMETVMNRAMATGRSLKSILTDPGYYPSQTKNKLGRSNFGSSQADLESALERVLNGSNITNFATDNASNAKGNPLARRRLAAGNQGSTIKGELFYINKFGSGGGGVRDHYQWAEAQASNNADLPNESQIDPSLFPGAPKATAVDPADSAPRAFPVNSDEQTESAEPYSPIVAQAEDEGQIATQELNNKFPFITDAATYTEFMQGASAYLPKAELQVLDAKIRANNDHFKSLRTTNYEALFVETNSSTAGLDDIAKAHINGGGSIDEFNQFTAHWRARNQAKATRLEDIKAMTPLFSDPDKNANLIKRYDDAIKGYDQIIDRNDAAMIKISGMKSVSFDEAEPEGQIAFTGPPGEAAPFKGRFPNVAKAKREAEERPFGSSIKSSFEDQKPFKNDFFNKEVQSLVKNKGNAAITNLNDLIPEGEFTDQAKKFGKALSRAQDNRLLNFKKITPELKGSINQVVNSFKTEYQSLGPNLGRTSEFEDDGVPSPLENKALENDFVATTKEFESEEGGKGDLESGLGIQLHGDLYDALGLILINEGEIEVEAPNENFDMSAVNFKTQAYLSEIKNNATGDNVSKVLAYMKAAKLFSKLK